MVDGRESLGGLSQRGVVTGFLAQVVTGAFDSSWWEITWRTCQVSGAAVCVALAVGVPLGWWLGRVRHPIGDVGLLVARSGLAMPPVVLGLLLMLVLSRRGPLGSWEWLFTWHAMVLAQFLLVLPYPIAILADAIRALPGTFEKQLRGLGASRSQVVWWILRELRPSFALIVGAAIGRSLSEVGAVLIVGGNLFGKTRVLTTAIVAKTGEGAYTEALGLGGVLLVLAFLANVVVLAVTMRKRADVN